MKSIDNYPLILNASHIKEILGVSKLKAYEIMESSDFPLIRLGRLKRVGKDANGKRIQNTKGSFTRKKTHSLH